MAGVSVFNWVKNYGTINVLQDVSFESAHGKFNALVDPSCCGKSTLLRSIAGLESVQGGKVQQVEHPLELYDMPCNVFIATFIGSPAMNLIPVEVKAGKLATNGGQVLAASKHRLNSKFNLGIRPEHIKICASKTRGTFEAIVEALESTGLRIAHKE